jgi:hypothetical protein
MSMLETARIAIEPIRHQHGRLSRAAGPSNGFAVEKLWGKREICEGRWKTAPKSCGDFPGGWLRAASIAFSS